MSSPGISLRRKKLKGNGMAAAKNLHSIVKIFVNVVLT
jgi:hypothetical protein